MATPDLRHLRSFVAIAEGGSISAAAAQLRVAQSALTRQLQTLEHGCRGKLFQRSARGVAPTETGLVLLAHARGLLAQADAAIAEVRELNREPGGLVGIAAPPSLAGLLYPPLASCVLGRSPRVRLNLREALTVPALVALRQREVDLAVVSVPEPDPGLVFEPLCVEQMMLLGPPGDALLRDGPVAMRVLPGLQLLLPVGVGWMPLVRRRLGARGALFEARVQTESPGPMLAMVQAGLGYAVLPFSGAQAELAAGRIAGAPIRDFVLPRLLALPARQPPRRATQAVMEAIRSVVAELVAAGALSGGPAKITRPRGQTR